VNRPNTAETSQNLLKPAAPAALFGAPETPDVGGLTVRSFGSKI
jgi:hypothetical protein